MIEIDTTDQYLEALKLTSYMEAIAKDFGKNFQHYDQVGPAHCIVDQYNLQGIMASTGGFAGKYRNNTHKLKQGGTVTNKACAVVYY